MNAPRTPDEPALAALVSHAAPVGTHPDEQMWVAWQTGTLSPAARRAMADHIGSCPSCVDVYRAMAQMDEHARTEGLHTPSGSSWFVGSRVTMLAAATLVAAIGGALWTGQRRSPTPDVTVSQSAPASAPRGSNPAVTPAQPTRTPGAWALSLTAPPVQLPARYALVTRGSEDDRAFVQAFGAAIAPYRDGDYARAAALLGAVDAQFPSVPEAALYHGIARVLAGDAEAARDPLTRAQQAEGLRDTARWFAAAAAERTGRWGDATAHLQAVCAGTSELRAAACAALASLPRQE